MAERTGRARHRRARSLRPEGRHRFRYGPSRWAVPAGLAVAILVVVAVILLVTDVTTSTALTPLR